MPEIALDWIKKWALYSPKKMAFREYDLDREWNYSELDQRIEMLAAYLQNELKIQKGERIAVYSKNCAEYVFLFFASMRIGAILTPLNFRLTVPELDVLLNDAQPAVLIFEEDYQQAVKELQVVQQGIKTIALQEIAPFLSKPIVTVPNLQNLNPAFEDVVMILYTSGTTGIPKGAMITHKMLFWNSINTALRLELTSADHTQSFAPFFHTGGWNVLLSPFLHHGGSHTLLKNFDADVILQLMEQEKTTLLFGVPTMMQMLSDSDLFEKTDLSSVRYAIVGGAPMPIPLINKWNEKGIPVRQGYGLTEVGPNTFSLHQDDAVRKKGSIGFPNFYIDAKVVSEAGSECACNEVGELWLKSPVVTPGYWKRDEETKKAITDGWFHTGDMVRKDEEGYYYVVDRKKNMFISGGENVYPAEVEKVINSFTGVRENAVIGVKDEKWGEVGKAFIVVEKGHSLKEEALLQHCRENLAKFKIPKHIAFIEALPRNDAGKIDRKQLLEQINH